ncbi:bifunctional folylpolyglutamate synthase/dihydrofolate synthase [Neorhodopirellula pilleata]|uniref:Dihydrofolate synthase/folylpolyglutamate synthase n=1 Tax=Neorhodopirellula pilleata TaxID=2714738 RepID=A0A5C6A8X4_9BACT|nr:folylpolyglutamate synthase/dihydrofolate synthase family protein [Neorhodopirellula pilleata]TWT96432.1 Folylpolyglutamate synthase [Neorhodopirellula pilleata]
MPQTQSAAYLEATQWLYDRIDYERLGKLGANYRFTLDRMCELVRRLGHGNRLAWGGRPAGETPFVGATNTQAQARPRVVHIAGTKGKGSVATMTAAMLSAGGFRTGLYTSPHLVRLEERFRVDGEPASEDQMVDLINAVKPIVDAMADEPIGGPSFFELTTALAIEHFHRGDCEFWVLETGLGGRLDSTNVFQSDVTVITSIGLDHQHVLGDTIDKIAKEKAGIFKANVPAISGVTRPLARDVIRQHAEQMNVPLLEIDRDFQADEVPTEETDWGGAFSLSNALSGKTHGPVRLGLEGQHQIRNAALAMTAIDRLGVPLSNAMLSRLATLQIDARLERFQLTCGTTVILDAAHNPDSIAVLVETVTRRFPDRPVVGVFGTSADKDAGAMLRQLQSCFDEIILTRYHRNPRFVPTKELSRLAAQAGGLPYRVDDDPLHACETAIEKLTSAGDRRGVVVVCGSFFLAAELRPWLTAR